MRSRAVEMPSSSQAVLLCRASISQRLFEGRGLPRSALQALREGAGLHDLQEGAHDEPVVLSDEFNHESVRNEEEELETHGTTRAHWSGAAREEKCSFTGGWEVWAEVTVVGCWQRTGRRLSQAVAVQEVKHGEDAFFAATPPLDPLRFLLSYVATNRDGSHGGRKVTVLDAKMTHLACLRGE